MHNRVRTLIPLTLLAIGLGCGYSKSSATPNPSSNPMIQTLNPNSATHGAAQFQLEVDGSNFASGAVINFNGTAETTTYTNSGKVTAMIPASAIATAGMAPVTVTNPATGGMYGTPAVTSAAMNFTIN